MGKYTLKKYQPASLRIWHWINAFVILGLLSTVLLRKTFLSWRTNSALIEAKLRDAGITVTADLAKDIAVSIRTPMWDWHYILGFTLTAALVLRVIVALFVEKKSPFATAVCGLRAFFKAPAVERKEALHYALVKTGYGLFYLCVVVMMTTGLLMYFRNELNLTKDAFEQMKERHEQLMWFFVVFVVGHILGVVVAENQQNQGIVSDMINGGQPSKPTK
jgi:Ni/Fe-hydrogenase 1 B-type cytochrome subunit